MKPHKLVSVEWVDSCATAEVWSDFHSTRYFSEDPALNVSVGYLVEKTKRWVILAMTIGFSDNEKIRAYGRLFKIPSECVKRFRVVK